MSAKVNEGPALSKELVVLNKQGIHARPAAKFVQTANKFASDIFVQKGSERVNGKSIMGLMMLAAGPGSKFTVHAHGKDAEQALLDLEELVNSKFGEA